MPRIFGGTRATAAGGAPATPPLDAFTTNLAGAWDYRRLLTSWTGALIRVQRTSPDTTQQDIGYDSNNLLNTTALAAFVGSASAYVVKRYDQSGNARDLIGAGGPASVGPRIVNAGTIETLNTKPCGKVVNGHDETEATAPFSASFYYTGTTVTGIWAGRLGTTMTQHETLLGLGADANLEYLNTAMAYFITINDAGVPNLYTYRGGTLGAGLSFTSGATFAVSGRTDGTNVVLRNAGGSQSTASSADWGFNIIRTGVLHGPNRLGADSYAGTMAVWFGDVGVTNTEIIRAEAATFYGGT